MQPIYGFKAHTSQTNHEQFKIVHSFEVSDSCSEVETDSLDFAEFEIERKKASDPGGTTANPEN
jgi:hypothetical protein